MHYATHRAAANVRKRIKSYTLMKKAKTLSLWHYSPCLKLWHGNRKNLQKRDTD
jgi:hypothetical protein